MKPSCNSDVSIQMLLTPEPGERTVQAAASPLRHKCTCMYCQFCLLFIHLPTLLSRRVQQILNMDQQITPQDAYCQPTEPSGRCQASSHICIWRQKITTTCQEVGNGVVSTIFSELANQNYRAKNIFCICKCAVEHSKYISSSPPLARIHAGGCCAPLCAFMACV